MELGCDGVISSASKPPAERTPWCQVPDRVSRNTPSVHTVTTRSVTVDVRQAFFERSDYIVVGGRSRTHQIRAKQPRHTAHDCGSVRLISPDEAMEYWSCGVLE